MPTIIFISTLTIWSMGQGNGGPAFYRTITEYINRGWNVFLITDDESNRNLPFLDDEHLIFVNAPKIKKWTLKRKIGLLFRYTNSFIVTRKYITAAKKILCDSGNKTVLYAYEVAGVAACKYLSKKYGVPFVTRFQGTILSQYRGTWADKIKKYPHYEALATKSDLVIMTDDGTQGELILDSLHNKSKTLFLQNGLELLDKDSIIALDKDKIRSFRSRIGQGITDEECMFLTVSRLVEWKKVERAIEGFAQFSNFGIPGKLVVVGDGNARNALEEYAKGKGISDRVYFIGSVPHEDVYKYMLSCDVFISLYDLSNVGNPLLEAMTLGKCIITLDIGDTNKIITNRKNGILLTKEELSTLGEVMAELAKTPELCKKLGKGAKNYAQNHFMGWDERMSVECDAVSKIVNAYGG